MPATVPSELTPELQAAFDRADRAIEGQQRNADEAERRMQESRVAGSERWACQILRAQLVAVLRPLGYEAP